MKQKVIFMSYFPTTLSSSSGHVNNRNITCCYRKFMEVPTLAHIKFTPSGSCDNFLSIMPDIFLRTSYQISSSNYIKVLDRVTTRSIRWFFLLQSVCGPSLVRSNSGVDGREYHSYFNPKIWPLNTFELPPFDYYFWTVAERKTVQRPNTIEHYLKAITMVAPVKVLRIPSIQLIPMLRVECTRSRGGGFL